MGVSVRERGSPGKATRVKYHQLALVCLLVGVAGLNLLSLLRFPSPDVDEAWRASRAWALIRTGRAFGTLDAGVFDRYEGYWTFFPWLEIWFTASAIRLLGLSLFAVRLVSLVFGLLLLVCLYAIASNLEGPLVGILGVVLVAFSRSFLLSSHLARQDIMVAAFGFGAVALHLTDRGRSFTVRSVLCGLATGVAFEIHPNGIIYGLVIVVLYLLDYGLSMLRSNRFRGFVLGVSIGFSFYVAMHVLPYPQTYIGLTRLGYSSTHTPPIMVLDPGVWLLGFRHTGELLLYLNPAEALLGSWAMVLLLQRRSTSELKLLFILGTLFVAVSLLIRNKIGYYGILIYPMLHVLLAAGMARVAQEACRAFRRNDRRTLLIRGLTLALACFCVVQGSILRNLRPLLSRPMADFQKAMLSVRQTVPVDSTVMGTQTYWFAIPDQRYLSWEQLAYYRRYVPDSSLEDALHAFLPDYLIIDRHMRYFMTDNPGATSPYRGFLTLPKADMDAFLAQQGHLVRLIETSTFGSIEIYKIDWH